MDIASSIAGSILEKLGSNAYKHIVSAWGLGDELTKLKKTLEGIQIVLSAAEENQDKDGNIREWLKELKDVLHDVKNVLDEFEIQDQLRRQPVNRGMTGSSVSQSNNKVRNLFLAPRSIGLRFKLSKKISKIWERLREIELNKNQFRLERQERGSREQRRRDTHSGVDVHTVIGRDDDKKKIIELLMGPSEDCSVISIVGLGGLGKTTLAILVYNDDRVVEQFPVRIWVCVSSEDFNVNKVAKEILISAKVVPSDDWSLQRLREEIQAFLQGRKLLLVLDDVWNEDSSKWEDLRNVITPGGEGSRIIVTTRSKNVASIMSRQKGYELSLSQLSHDNCLSLFLRYAYIAREDEHHQNLVEIGKEIVNKCGRNPLAAKKSLCSRNCVLVSLCSKNLSTTTGEQE